MAQVGGDVGGAADQVVIHDAAWFVEMASGYGVPFAALGPLICVAYAVAFGVAAALLSRALPHQPRGSGDAKGVSSAFAPLQAPHMTARGRAVWLNTATSALHSAMSCVGVFVAVAALTAGPAPEGSSEAVIDLMGNDHAAPFLVLAASAGYFLFDTVDYVVKGLHVCVAVPRRAGVPAQCRRNRLTGF